MAKVKTFRIHKIHGVPDKEITEFLTECEKEAIISVTTEIIPANEQAGIDSRISVIVTKLDDIPLRSSVKEDLEELKAGVK